MTVIAIDFGTSRVKAAYISAADGRVHTWMIGQDEKPWIPSLIYMKKGEEPRFGEDAEAMLQDDHAGVLMGFKRRIKETRVRLNGAAEDPQALLAKWFAYLRTRAGKEIREFHHALPVEVLLTVPAMFLPREREMYEKAASEAGFSSVRLVDEPSAAAQYWLFQGYDKERDVLVLDCGGGTVDWALVHWKDGRFEHDTECVPGGDPHLGGEDVNEELVAVIEKSYVGEFSDSDLPKFKDIARRAKEHFCRTGKEYRTRLDGETITVSVDDIKAAIDSRFVTRVVNDFSAFAQKARVRMSGTAPTVLIVGGSGRIPHLRDEVTERLKDFDVVWWEHSEFATVKGALAGVLDTVHSKKDHEQPLKQVPAPAPAPVPKLSPKEKKLKAIADAMLAGGEVQEPGTRRYWLKNASPEPLNWHDAMDVCPPGYRLPTIEELKGLIGGKGQSMFGAEDFEFYWSSSSYAGYEDYAWYVSFGNGDVGYYYKTYTYRARCVRGGP